MSPLYSTPSDHKNDYKLPHKYFTQSMVTNGTTANSYKLVVELACKNRSKPKVFIVLSTNIPPTSGAYIHYRKISTTSQAYGIINIIDISNGAALSVSDLLPIGFVKILFAKIYILRVSFIISTSYFC